MTTPTITFMLDISPDSLGPHLSLDSNDWDPFSNFFIESTEHALKEFSPNHPVTVKKSATIRTEIPDCAWQEPACVHEAILEWWAEFGASKALEHLATNSQDSLKQ